MKHQLFASIMLCILGKKTQKTKYFMPIKRAYNPGGKMWLTDLNIAWFCIISKEFCVSKPLCNGTFETQESTGNNLGRLHTQGKMWPFVSMSQLRTMDRCN